MAEMVPNNPEDKSKRHTRFFQLYTQNQSLIYSYILTFVPRFHEADDIFQEVSTAMWEHFDSFKAGTDFLAWGRAIAHNQIVDYIRRCQRSRVLFSTETVQLLVEYMTRQNEQQDRRIRALESCMTKLSEKDRFLVKERYSTKTTIKNLALRVGRSVEGLYKSFARIHSQLYNCIQRTLVAEIPSDI